MTSHRKATPVESQLDAAEQALDRGDFEEALDICGMVLDREPHHAGAHFLAADALRDLREPHEAEQHYRAVLKVETQHAPSWSGLAGVLFDQLRYEESRIAALRAIRCEPDFPEGYYIRAMLRERRGDE